MPRPKREPPCALTPGWPDEPSPDSLAEVARRFALNLAAAIGPRSLREVGRAADLHHSSLAMILEGRTWPDLATIAKIEGALDADIWPGRPND